MANNATHTEGVVTEASAPPAETKITWKDFWDNRRVLGFCE